MKLKFFGAGLVTALLTVTAAHAAIEIPDIQAGLWETIGSAGVNTEALRVRTCTDNSVNQRLFVAQQKMPSACTVVKDERLGEVFTQVVECPIDGRLVRYTSVLTMRGNTSFHLETRGPDNKLRSVLDSRYLGACPADMVLGDTVGPDGMKFNVFKPPLQANPN